MANRYFAVLVLIFISITNSAHALDGFVDIGASNYEAPEDGVFWQKRFDHAFDAGGLYVRTGVELPLTHSTTLKAFYFNTAKYRLTALTTQWDDDYDPSDPSGCTGGTCAGKPFVRWVTSGGVQGLGLTFNRRLYGNFYAEAGVTYYDQEFSIRVTDASGADVSVHDAKGNYVGGYFAQGMHQREWGTMLGLSWKRNGYSLAFHTYTIGAKYPDEGFAEDCHKTEGMPSYVNRVSAIAISIPTTLLR